MEPEGGSPQRLWNWAAQRRPQKPRQGGAAHSCTGAGPTSRGFASAPAAQPWVSAPRPLQVGWAGSQRERPAGAALSCVGEHKCRVKGVVKVAVPNLFACSACSCVRGGSMLHSPNWSDASAARRRVAPRLRAAALRACPADRRPAPPMPPPSPALDGCMCGPRAAAPPAHAAPCRRQVSLPTHQVLPQPPAVGAHFSRGSPSLAISPPVRPQDQA